MDELKNIDDLAEQAEAIPFQTVLKLQQENAELREKVLHLEALLSSTTKLLDEKKPDLEVTAEQVICEMQIKRLQEKASTRELSLEETKRLEILVKSLYLIKERGGSGQKPDWSLPAGTSIDSLSQIAASPDPQPDAD